MQDLGPWCKLTRGSLIAPGFCLYQSARRPMLGWMTLTPAWAAATAWTKLHTSSRFIGHTVMLSRKNWRSTCMIRKILTKNNVSCCPDTACQNIKALQHTASQGNWYLYTSMRCVRIPCCSSSSAALMEAHVAGTRIRNLSFGMPMSSYS